MFIKLVASQNLIFSFPFPDYTNNSLQWPFDVRHAVLQCAVGLDWAMPLCL